MAFLRYARANVVRPQVHSMEWDKVRVASGSSKLNNSLRKKAEEILGESFTPERFLLTHATIVCSVDAVQVPFEIVHLSVAGLPAVTLVTPEL